MASASGSEEKPNDAPVRQSSLIADKHDASDYSLGSKRKSVILNAGPRVPQISVDDFFENFLPKTVIKPFYLKAIHARVLETLYEHDRWKSFPLDPGPSKAPEDEAFLGLVDIAKAVRDAALYCVPRLRAQTTFDNIPDSPPVANNRPNMTRPDGSFVRADAMSSDHKSPHWIDIAATGEYKKSGLSRNDLTDDIHKALWNMHHTMREDATRRFTFAFTIENRTMRLWFASRSEILVSESFDFMDEPKRLVEFFLSFTFASKEELGWDPTMKCRWNGVVGSPFQYDITVRHMDTKQDVVYRTQELVSDVGANHIRGRGTRVWRVKKVSKNHRVGKTDFILKDAWVDSGRTREGKVLAKIRGSTKDPEVIAKLDEILLHMSMHGDVYIGDTMDQTVSGPYRDAIIRDNKVKFSLNHVSPNQTATGSSGEELKDNKKGKAVVIRIDEPVGDYRDPPPVEKPEDAIEPLYYPSKVHYRIVFKEVCVPLHSINSLRSYVYLLYKATRALRILHRLGWVHRDISAGNILLCGTQVKLADLEYAKLMTSTEPAHDIRTGTAAFMAVEVEDQGYCFPPEWLDDLRNDRYTAEDDEDDSDSDSEGDRTPDPGKLATAPKWDAATGIIKEGWCYNPLHDMESIIWLFARGLLYRDHYFQRVDGIPVTPFVIGKGENAIDPFAEENSEERIKRIKAYYTFGRGLFVTRTTRYKTMYQSRYLGAYLKAHPLFPGVVPLRGTLIQMRKTLVEQYHKAEMDIATIDHTCAKELTTAFMNQLRVGHQYLMEVADRGYEIHTRSLQAEFEMFCQQDRSGISAGTKRSRDEADDDGEEEKDSVSHPAKSPRTETNSSPHPSPVAGPSRLPATPAPAVAVAVTIPTIPEPVEPSSPPAANPPARPTRRTAGVPPATRTLRSHARKAATLKAASPSPKLPSPARPARSRKPASRKGKATKNDEAVRAAAKVAAKVKSKTRKGR